MQKILIILYISFAFAHLLSAQSAPSNNENIPYLVTFGSDSRTSWGDDDFCQTFFFIVPPDHTDPIYLRVFDPDISGNLDEAKGVFDTEVNFSIYGGMQAWSHPDAQGEGPKGKYRSGMLLASKTFKSDEKYNLRYYSFGPFNPSEGEYVEKFDGRVFKIIAEGVSGDDGNLYRYFLSTDPHKNIPVEGANLFTYKYTFRLHNDQSQVSQLYPFVDEKTTSIEISNFDWDEDGFIRVISVAKNGILCPVSGDDNWEKKQFPITEKERNTTIEIQLIKNQKRKITNNNVVIVVKNQYGQNLPFFVIPLGGVPVYIPKIRVKEIE